MSEPREDLNDLSADERHLERLLAALPPRESRLNRDRTLFLAGQASAARHLQTRRFRGWVWPAATICSTAAGLLAGMLISASTPRGSAVPPTPSAREDVVERREPIASEKLARNEWVGAAESPSLLDLRVRMASRAGDEFLLAQVDPLPHVPHPEDLAAGRTRAGGPPVAVTYGEILGRLLKEEEQP